MPRKIQDPINDFIRAQIRRIRMQKRLSTRQVSALAEIPEGSYNCLENGFYRISTTNLQKILRALELRIGDVWPEPLAPRRVTKAGRPAVAGVHHFRFREVCELTQAQSAALVYRDPSGTSVLFSHNLRDEERDALTGSLETGDIPEFWTVYAKRRQSATMSMCLMGTAAETPLVNLIEVYLDLWLATEVAAAAS